MDKIRLDALRMPKTTLDTTEGWCADDHGAAVLPARRPAISRRAEHNVFEGIMDEAGKLDFDDRFQAVQRHADGVGNDPFFIERRIDDAF